MNKKLHSNRRFLASLFASVYLFAVVFSGFFHTHTNNFKEDLLSFSKKPVSEKIVNFGGVDDCFSSHFFNAGIGILDAEANFQFIISKEFTLKNFQYHFTVPTEKVVFFSLRAPPVFI